MVKLTYNERSLAIDLISWINAWSSSRDVVVKRAGGEATLSTGRGSLFPDVVLYGDEKAGMILQGWELKMPDTDIDDVELIDNAKKKAKLLELDSFFIWNVSVAKLYRLTKTGRVEVIKTWDKLSYIKKREEVEPNKEKIEAFLHEVLEDLANYFEKGTISSTRFVDVISGELLASFLNSNLRVYEQALEAYAQKDAGFRDEVNIWWRYQKASFEKNISLWEVLAKNNLTVLLNRFIFAHILKTYSKDAFMVDEIIEGTILSDALETFETISKKCDFWNIFTRQHGEEALPEAVWMTYIKLNKFLIDSKLQALDSGFYHEILEKTVNRQNRRIAGQFVTPPQLARLLANLVVDSLDGVVGDPCCGTGTILKAVSDLKKDAKMLPGDILKNTWASDKFSFPLHMATLSLIEPEDMGVLLKVFSSDVSDLKEGMTVEFRDPNNGDLVVDKLPKFDYVLSNLPYVQQEDLNALNPEIKKINELISAGAGGEPLDPKGDLYSYIPFYLWTLMKDSGKLGIIISNSWLGTKWGDVFRRQLYRFFDVKCVVASGAGRWFKEAKVVGNILVLQKRNKPLEKGDSEVKFITIKTPLEELDKENKWAEIASVARKMDSVDDDDVLVIKYSSDELSRMESLGLKWSALFAKCDWIFSVADKLVKANTLFDINRGERRGWDPMFYPGTSNNIEQEFLEPVLKSSRNITSLIAEPDAQAFCCQDSKVQLEERGCVGALEWIGKFEKEVNTKNVPLVKCLKRPNINWYTMLPNTMADMVTSMNPGDRLFFAQMRKKAFVDQRLIRFTAEEGVDVDLCMALLNSVMGLFYLEALGFGRGEGVLDLNATKLKESLRVLNPTLLSPSACERIKEAFAPLLQRAPLPMEEELEAEDRLFFEQELFKEFQLPLTILDSVKTSLLTVYRIRVSVNKKE